MKSQIYAALTAFILIVMQPLPSFAAIAGMACEKSEIGKTELDDNRKNIIGCLITDNGKSQIWKNFGGTDRMHSLNCDDWEDLGWGSKEACIMDGRWHLVYINDANGNAIYGSVDDLKRYGYDYGAEVKNADEEGTHYCQTFSYRNGVANCMDGMRVSGQVFSTTMTSNDNTLNLGAATRRTDGVRLAANIARSPSGIAEANNGRPPNTLFKWYVRF